MDTIFALASARGQAGIAVIRVSGPSAKEACDQLAGTWLESGRARLRKLRWRGEILDQALVLAFEGPNSFTGEDVVEFHTHGSKAVVAAVLNALGEMQGLRLAGPGEFTRRALENDRLSLDEIEGLGDLITAETEGQRRQAMRAFSGRLRERVEIWRAALLRATALAEVTIDFADEEVPVDTTPDVLRAIEDARHSLSAELSGFAAAEKVRDGFEVAIVGAPNVGKSSLLNALAGRDAAITSDIAGTTRDIVEVQMDLSGLPVTFLDTAGLRETEDQIESIGIARARERAEAADLRMILLEARDQTPPVVMQEGDIILVTKSDLRDGDVSSETGEGLPELLVQIGSRFEGQASQAGAVTRLRHKLAIEATLDHLDIAREVFESSGPTELGAEELRQAINHLDALVGRIDVEHVLGEIFSSFCIGK